jgi:hypothetical protein
MKHILYRYGCWVLVLSLLLLAMVAQPANAAQQQQQATATNLDAYIYLPTEALKPIFQNQISQQVNTLSAGVINKMLDNLPKANQGWAKEMAGALIQPSATLSQLTPQKDGLATTVSLSFYPGDPKPINAAMLVTLGVRDASTIQVSAQPMPGSPQLANGPLTTFTMPVGQLKGINATPDCGSAGLNAHIQLPITFNTSQASTQSQSNQIAHSTLPANQTLAGIKQSHVAYTTQNKAASTLDAYIELTNSSLNALGKSIDPIVIGSVPFNNPLTAENLDINIQGDGLVITAGIYTEPPLHPRVATATAFVQPNVENGQLVMRVTDLNVEVLDIISLPKSATDNFKQQIQTMLNNNLGNALAGKFTVNNVSVGGGAALPCAGSDSLILKGTTNLT